MGIRVRPARLVATVFLGSLARFHLSPPTRDGVGPGTYALRAPRLARYSATIVNLVTQAVLIEMTIALSATQAPFLPTGWYPHDGMVGTAKGAKARFPDRG
jgi:hypothetical protein